MKTGNMKKWQKMTPRKKAQAMVEFALVLPVLLLVVFGVLEYGRLLYAWIIIENSTRIGLRYATTGQYNPAYCTSGCSSDTDTDAARIPSIKDVTREIIVGLPYNQSVTDTQNDYLNITVCSSREAAFNPPQMGGTHYASCAANEDAGGPNDTVVVAADYNFAFIILPHLPFASALAPMIHLASYREGQVEAFRATRSIDTPVPLNIPLTPSNTPVPPTSTPTPPPTLTPTITNTPTPTDTFTPTSTSTPTNTPTNTATKTPTNTATPTVPSKTPTPSNTPTKTFTPTATVPSATPTKTFTATATVPSNTPTKTFTPTITYTPSRTPTPSNTPTKTFTPTITLTPSKTPTHTPVTPSNTPTASNTPTKTFTPTATVPSNTPTNTATRTPTRTPTATVPTPTPSNTPTKTPTRTPTNTPPLPTSTPSLTPSPTNTQCFNGC